MSAARRIRSAMHICSAVRGGMTARTLPMLLALAMAAPAAAQQRTGQTTPHIERTGRGILVYDRALDALLADDYTLVSENLLVANGDTLAGPVLVAGATLRVNGTIDGDLYIVDANVFLRPTAVVTGSIYNLGGGLYPSEQAQVAGVTDEPIAPYEVERLADGSLRIVGTRSRSALVLDGFRGVRIPTYDRVDGLSVGVGAGLLTPPLASIEPMVRGWAEYRVERSEFTGGGELSAARGATTLAVGAERTTESEDRWIRGDLTNSLSTIWDGDDYRNYYQSDRGWVEARRVFETGQRISNAFLRFQVEDATSLPAGDPWIIRQPDSIRPNPAVADIRISSLLAGGSVTWDTPNLVGEVAIETEFAFDVLDGERSFRRFAITGEAAIPALADHTLEVEWHFRGPFPGTDSLPRQRWSFVGGSGTLYTYDIAAFPGDRVAFAGLTYVIPLPARLTLPLIGRPSFNLLQTTAAAWTHDIERVARHNLGAELRWPFFYARVIADPENFDEPEFSVNVSFPRGSLPWQR